jgi:putative membrane protein
MQLLLRWVISAAALFATVLILQALKLASATPGTHWSGWFVAAIIMGLVNALIRPVARLLTAPLNCMTFGLMGLVVNAIMFWLVSALSGTFKVEILGALLGSLLVGAIGGLLNNILIREDEK